MNIVVLTGSPHKNGTSNTLVNEFIRGAMEPGKVIVIPSGVKHWHGAKKDSWFSHISIEVPGEKTSNEWLEAVSDEEYGKLGE